MLLLVLVSAWVSQNVGVVYGMQVLDRGQFLNSLWIASHPGLFLLDDDSSSSSLLLSGTTTDTKNSMTTMSSSATTDTTTTSDSICRNGALVPEQSIPGAYNQVCMTLPERSIPIGSSGSSSSSKDDKGIILKIQQEASGSGRTGMAVWNSGLILTRLLERLEPILSPPPTSILELGCGTGLVSIAADHLWKSADVMATDGNPDVVQLAQRNIQLNCQQQQNNNGDKIHATVLPWGLLNAVDYSADLILGADLTYNSGSWRVLAETMSTILTPSGYVVYVSLGHEGFNVNPEVDGFLSVAREVGGLVPVTELGGVPIYDALLKDILSPAEVKNVQASGGVRVAVLRRKEFLKRQAKQSSK
jgi:SAM-dependent methyltransferase